MPKNKNEKKEYFKINCIDNNSKFEITYTNSFLKGVKKHFKNRNDLHLLCQIIIILSKDGDIVAKKYKAHNLKGNLKSFREAHIKPDILLIWKVSNNMIVLTAIGTHNELFN